MESETVVYDCELSGTSSTNLSTPSFPDLVESKCEGSVLPLSTEINACDSYQGGIPQFEQKPAVNKITSLSESGLTRLTPGTVFMAESPKTSETIDIINKSIEPSTVLTNNSILSDQDNITQSDIPVLSLQDFNNTHINTCNADSTPGPSCKSAYKEIFTCLSQEDLSQQDTETPENNRRRTRSYYKTRESQRIKKSPPVITVQKSGKERCIWSVKDKKILLKALEQWGSENIKALHKKLPHKMESDIFNHVKMWKDFAQVELQKKFMTEMKKSDSALVNCVMRLDEWIQHFAAMEEVSSNKLFALSNVFLLISEYGNFPPPSQCNNLDFRAMYRYIHCMLNGLPYHGVNQVTAKVLNDSISDMFTIIKEHQQVNYLQPHLYSTSWRAKPRCRTYGRPRSSQGVAMSKNPNAIVSLPDLNPLNIPPHVLVKPEVEEYEYDEDDEFNN